MTTIFSYFIQDKVDNVCGNSDMTEQANMAVQHEVHICTNNAKYSICDQTRSTRVTAFCLYV